MLSVRGCRIVVGALSIALGAGTASAKTLAKLLGAGGSEPVADALAGAVGRALPLVSASSGVVYSYDPTSGAFVRETSILGQLFLERAQPLGKNRLNVNVSYQWVHIDTFDGKDVGTLRDTTHPLQPDPKFPDNSQIFPLFDIDLTTHQTTASATYGLTDDIDLNLTVPLLVSDFSRHSIQIGNPGTQLAAKSEATLGDTKIGFGDVFLRGKYRALDRDDVQAALGLVLRLPAGNKENFQGTGEVDVAPRVYLSSRPLRVAGAIQVQAYLNAGITFRTDDVSESDATYGVGIDCGVPERATAAVAFLGRSDFARIAPAGSLSFRRSDGTSRPIFGIEDRRGDVLDLSIGGRANLWRGIVIGFANVIVALNDDGVRSDVIPMIGVEASF